MVGFGLREREGTGSVKTLFTCLVGHDVDGGCGWIAFSSPPIARRYGRVVHHPT